MKVILFADNDPDLLVTRAEFLENEGYQVLKAFTLEEARRLLTEAYVHLAILDIRMVNDDDEKDVSGLTLAKGSAYRSIPKIILTGFPSVSAVKEALGPALEGLPPAVDFVAKAEGSDAMIQAVKKAFEFVHINWNLDIQWDPREPLSFPHLVSLLHLDLPNSTLVHRASEMEDLVRQLFYEYRQIRLGRLLWHNGLRFCLLILARSPQETTDSRLLVCGDREVIAQERNRANEFIPKALQGIRLYANTETIHFDANAYVLPDTDIETVQTLRALFQASKEKPLKSAFSHLLGNVLKAWHQHGQIVQKTSDLLSLYRQLVGLAEDKISRTEVEQRAGSLVQSARILEGVEISRDNQQMTFHLPQQSPLYYPDPVTTVYTPLTQYDTPVVCRVSPGRLTANNVLVDATQKTWLTDFALAGQAPQWWDFICLEAAIRFELSQAPDLLAWQDFEECLVKPASLTDGLKQSDVIPELRTSIALIEQIRQQAASETGGDALPYYAGLLAWAVEAMAHYDPGVLYTQADRLRGAHLLLAAAMIAGRLNETPSSPPRGGILKSDDDGTVWLGTRRIAVLMGFELNLLRCLYEHAQAGRIVSRKEIVEAVYEEKYDASDKSQEQRITALISRLREKIEPHPDRPCYILTARGGGYRLQASGESEK